MVLAERRPISKKTRALKVTKTSRISAKFPGLLIVLAQSRPRREQQSHALPKQQTAWYEKVVSERSYQFEWDETKASANERKHGVAFDLAASIFNDPHLLTVADLEHGEAEERWFSVGVAQNRALLSVSYLWLEADTAPVAVRLISARRATRTERRQYEENL